MYYVDPNIANTERVFPDQNRSGFMRLDMNENPEGLPDEIVRRIQAAVTPEFLATYPEPDVFLKKYAQFIGVAPNQVCATNGSDNAIRYVLQTFARKGSSVLTVDPSFEMYMVNCWLLGLEHKTVPYKDMRADTPGIVSAIDDSVDIVVLVNPNNPMGDVYAQDEVRAVLEAAKAHDAIVVIDEAYHYFTDSTHLSLIDEYDNLIVFRTFSKCFSLAGVRLGVVISNPALIHYVNNLRVSFETNAFALKCGEIVLDEPGLVERLAETQVAGRDYVVSELDLRGYTVIPSETNFVSFKPNSPAGQVADRLKERKVLVKTFNHGPLAGWIRINTGSVAVMERFLDELAQADR